MARTKGSANFAGSLEVLAGAPLDARLVVPALADLTVAANFPYKYLGMVVAVPSEHKAFMLIGADVTNINNWHEIGGSGGADNVKEGYLNPVDGKFYKEQAHTTEIAGAANTLYVELEQEDIYRYDGSDFINLTGIDVTVYQPGGSYAFASIPANNASHLGMVYNITDSFTTTADFLEGAGIEYGAGTDVAVVNAGTAQSPSYKYNVLVGDMSGYQKKVQYGTLPTASVDYVNKVLQYTGDDGVYKCGAYYRCEAQETDPVTYKWERKPSDMMFGEKASAADVAAAKAAFQPVNMSNVRLWEIYDEDGTEMPCGEVRKTIDGVKKKKPRYRKVIVFTTGYSSGTYTLISDFISTNSIDDVCAIDGVLKTSAGAVYPHTAAGSRSYISIESNGSLRLVIESTSSNWIPTVYVEYTKTTDQWETA